MGRGSAKERLSEELISFHRLCDVVSKDGKVQKGHLGGLHEGAGPMTSRGILNGSLKGGQCVGQAYSVLLHKPHVRMEALTRGADGTGLKAAQGFLHSLEVRWMLDPQGIQATEKSPGGLQGPTTRTGSEADDFGMYYFPRLARNGNSVSVGENEAVEPTQLLAR